MPDREVLLRQGMGAEFPGWICPVCGAWDSGSVMPRRAQWCDGACSHPKTEMVEVVFVRRERLDEALEASDWGEEFLRSEDERKRQGDRAHKWKERSETLLVFVQKMWLELDDAADGIDPVPDLVERNLRLWHKEAELLLKDTP